MNSNNNKEKLLSELRESLSLKNDNERIEFERDKIQLDLMYLISMIMDSKGWSKAELAEKIHTSKAYISQLFSCDKKLNLETLAKIKFVSNARFKFILDEQESRLAELDLVNTIQKDNFTDECPNQLVDKDFLELEKDTFKDKTGEFKYRIAI